MAQVSVHLSSLASDQNPTLRKLKILAEKHLSNGYVLTKDRKEADIILFVENGYVGLSDIPRVLRIRNENRQAALAMFSECDWPFAFLPGLYTSLVKHLPWALGWSFVLDDTEMPAETGGDCRYLFSFLGRLSTHPVRSAVRRLNSALTPCLDITEAQSRLPNWDYHKTFAQVLSESRFVLCPRGIGASSIRIFEAMRAGRVPLVISDAWIEPPVGHWPDFSIRVRENDVASIPKICADHAGLADKMGAAARAAFERYFAPAGFLDNALDCIRANIAQSSRCPTSLSSRVLKALTAREFSTIGHRARHALVTHRA